MTSLVAVFALAAGLSVPLGPSVNVMPEQGKSFELFQSEDATCQKWAQDHTGGEAGQDSINRNMATGAVAGTALGAGLGAVVGSASGRAGVGAAIGAAGGLITGLAAGASAGQAQEMAMQRQYDNAYIQCMYSHGNQVPALASEPVDNAPESIEAPPAPDFVLAETPQFVYSPVLGMYVALGIQQDLLYTGSSYLYNVNGIWYSSPYIYGPWGYFPRAMYPPIFSTIRIEHIRGFREAEFRRFNMDRKHYAGKMYRPDMMSERRGFERRETERHISERNMHRDAERRVDGHNAERSPGARMIGDRTGTGRRPLEPKQEAKLAPKQKQPAQKLKQTAPMQKQPAQMHKQSAQKTVIKSNPGLKNH